MEKILALYDSDVFYATRFMDYFIKKNDTGLEISVFTRRESLEDYLRGQQVEILLLGEPLELEERFLNQISYRYQLSDKPFLGEGEAIPFINKYQPVSTLIKDVLMNYSKISITSFQPNPNKLKIISIFSPIVGTDKGSFAWSLSSLLSEQERTLLVLMELLPVPIVSVSDSKKYALTDYIYYLKENAVVDKIEKLSGTCGKLTVLSGILNGADLLSLSADDIKKWTMELSNNSGYQTIVFYLGFYSEASIELMKLSDTVILPILQNQYELAAMEEWEHQMSQMGINTKQEKFQVLRLQPYLEELMLPLTLQELMGSRSWTAALQFLDKRTRGYE